MTIIPEFNELSNVCDEDTTWLSLVQSHTLIYTRYLRHFLLQRAEKHMFPHLTWDLEISLHNFFHQIRANGHVRL